MPCAISSYLTCQQHLVHLSLAPPDTLTLLDFWYTTSSPFPSFLNDPSVSLDKGRKKLNLILDLLMLEYTRLHPWSFYLLYSHPLPWYSLLGSCQQLPNVYLQPIYFSQNPDSAFYLDVLKIPQAQHVHTELLIFSQNLLCLQPSISGDSKIILQVAQTRILRVILDFFSHIQHSSLKKFCWFYFQNISRIRLSHYLHCYHTSLNKYFLPRLLQ